MVLELDTLPRKAWVALLAAAATVGLSFPLFSHFSADYFARQATREDLDHALALQPENAEFHNRLGRLLLYAPLGDASGATAELERATQLAPGNGLFHVDLALARELTSDAAGAARALDQARRVEPHTPAILWHQTNFLLRRGEIPRALETLRELLQEAPEYTAQALPLVSRVAPPQVLIEQVVPLRTEALEAVLDFLRRENRPGPAGAAWRRVLQLTRPPADAQIRSFVDWLIASGEVGLAQKAWAEVARRQWIPLDTASSLAPIYNADFQYPLQNFGFDWRVTPHPEASVWIEARGPEPGRQSLCVQFAENARADYAHVYHYIPVEPNFYYALHASLRSERLASRLGAWLQVRSIPPVGGTDGASLVARTDAVTGTGGWREVALRVETGPESRLLQLSLLRPGPSPAEEPASGLVCFSALSWEALGPVNAAVRSSGPTNR